MNKMDKISVIMGIYNCAETLPRAIDSIICQTYTEWELILCDDASTDRTYLVAADYQKKFPEKIILIKNERNLRLAATLNRCLEYATGKYVARMDGDDEARPDRFEKQIQYLNLHPEIDLVGTSILRIFDEKRFYVKAVEKPDRFTMRNRLPFFHSTILTYRYVYERLNGYTAEKRTRRAEDQELWFRFFYAGFGGANLQEALYIIYETDDSIRRRKASDRWLTFQVMSNGFKLLGYPRRWIIKPFFSCLLRMLTPHWAQKVYRLWQHASGEKKFQNEKK